jgi:flagellar hook-associated protein 3 FlgL
MRVTTQSVYATSAAGLQAALGRVQDQSARLSSGKSVMKWSDDAPAAASAEALRAQEADLTSFARSAGDAQGWLSSADGQLTSMSSLLADARGLAVSAVNGGLSASSREAIATSLDGLRGQLRDIGASTYLGRPLFGGFGGSTGSALGEGPGGAVTFTGDSQPVRRQVSPSVLVQVNVDGRAVLGFDGAAGEDVFSTLSKLSAAVRTGDTAALGTLQGRLQGHADAVGRGLSQVGATGNRVASVTASSDTLKVDLAARRSELEDVDIAEAIMSLNAAQAGYQAALGATARANLPSLADFLK